MAAEAKRRRRWPRRLVLGLGVLLLLLMVGFGFVFSRSIHAVQLLGSKAITWNFPYLFDNVTQLHLCQAEDHFQRAIAYFERETANDEGVTKYRRLLARLYVNDNRLDEAEKLYRTLLEAEPDDPELLKGLGLLLMRKAELQNCTAHAAYCIYPLPRSHPDTSFAEEAHGLFQRADEVKPSWSMKWMVHLSKMAMDHGSVDIADFARPGPDDPLPPRLTEAALTSGVAKVDLGRGGLVGDFDGDGRLDFVVASTLYELGFYRNNGDRSFEDWSVRSGVGNVTSGFIVSAGDIDNDGDLDLYVSRNAFFGQMSNVMLRNDGNGVFEDVTEASGTGDHGSGFVAAFADYDLDGDLDLFVANLSNPVKYIGGAIAKTYGRNSNVLYRNRGDGTFENVTEQAGLDCIDSHLGASWGDFDADGDPDLYATTYFGMNHLYVNQGDGTFVDRAKSAGVREPWSSFSGWFFDYDADTHLDLLVPTHAPTELVAKYQLTNEPPRMEQNMRLYRGDGKGGFVDVTEESGLRIGTSAMGANWGDINSDGYPDFYLGTGGPQLERLEPNIFFVNRGDGTFWNATFATDTGYIQKGHGVSFADLDGDGWQEMHVTLGGAWPIDVWANALHWNESKLDYPDRHFAKVVLRGRESNSHGVGARVLLTAGGRTLVREIGAGGGFGINAYLAEFGLDTADRIDKLEVVWPSPGGPTRQVFENLPVDVTLMVDEAGERPLILDPMISAPVFGIPEDALLAEYGRAPVEVASVVDP
jgi:hypothetical protein